jgi:hypothetical protein
MSGSHLSAAAVLGSKNIAKILLVPEFPVNFNLFKASLNL